MRLVGYILSKHRDATRESQEEEGEEEDRGGIKAFG